MNKSPFNIILLTGLCIVIGLSIYTMQPGWIVLQTFVSGIIYLAYIIINKLLVNKNHEELSEKLTTAIAINNNILNGRMEKIEEQVNKINMAQGLRKF